MTLAGSDESERIATEFVSAPYFSLLGVRPALGRTFHADDDDVAKPAAVVVMSDGLWRRRFAADPRMVGSSIILNGQPFTVVGIMPPGFTGVTDAAQLWIPFAQWAPPATMRERSSRGFNVLGRLKPGVSRAAAQAELDAIAGRLEREYPSSNEGRGIEVSALATEVYGSLRLALQVLMGAIALVLVIACANVANLLIARSGSAAARSRCEWPLAPAAAGCCSNSSRRAVCSRCSVPSRAFRWRKRRSACSSPTAR